MRCFDQSSSCFNSFENRSSQTVRLSGLKRSIRNDHPSDQLQHRFQDITDKMESSFLVQGYETVRWADRLIVLLAVDGSSCNTISANPCFEALTWVEDRFVSARPPAE